MTWSFSKTKGFFCFSFNNRCYLENCWLFCIHYFSKTKSKPAKKIQGDVSLFNRKRHAKFKALFQKKEKHFRLSRSNSALHFLLNQGRSIFFKRNSFIREDVAFCFVLVWFHTCLVCVTQHAVRRNAKYNYWTYNSPHNWSFNFPIQFVSKIKHNAMFFFCT